MFSLEQQRRVVNSWKNTRKGGEHAVQIRMGPAHEGAKQFWAAYRLQKAFERGNIHPRLVQLVGKEELLRRFRKERI